MGKIKINTKKEQEIFDHVEKISELIHSYLESSAQPGFVVKVKFKWEGEDDEKPDKITVIKSKLRIH